MTKKEYAAYEAAVADFFAAEGIENLSSGCVRCPECSGHPEMNFDGDYPACPDCGFTDAGVAFFSWRWCDCCKTSLGGNRYHSSGYHREKKEIYEYVICEDCVYYAEYGRLDDQTMDEIENSPE